MLNGDFSLPFWTIIILHFFELLIKIHCFKPFKILPYLYQEFATPLPFRKSRKMSSSTPNPKGDQSALENEVITKLCQHLFILCNIRFRLRSLDTSQISDHANCKKIWMPNHLKMWKLKSRSCFLPVQSKIWTARCHHDRQNFSPAEAWLHGCVVTRGRLQTDIGFTNRKFNQHCVNVALRTNLKKDDVQHNGLFQMLPDTWVF